MAPRCRPERRHRQPRPLKAKPNARVELLRDPIIMNCAGETIASWRRALGQTNGHKRRIFGRAAIALLQLTKNEQASERQSIIDEPPRPARRSVRSIFEKTPRTGSYRAKELSKAQERLL